MDEQDAWPIKNVIAHWFYAFTWLGVIIVDPNHSYGFRG